MGNAKFYTDFIRTSWAWQLSIQYKLHCAFGNAELNSDFVCLVLAAQAVLCHGKCRVERQFRTPCAWQLSVHCALGNAKLNSYFVCLVLKLSQLITEHSQLGRVYRKNMYQLDTLMQGLIPGYYTFIWWVHGTRSNYYTVVCLSLLVFCSLRLNSKTFQITFLRVWQKVHSMPTP